MLFEILILCILLTIYLLNKDSKKYPVPTPRPPGPWGLPILGHLPLLGDQPHTKIMEWKDKYGPIMLLQFGSFPTVVLNNAQLIKEAFNLPAFSGRGQLRIVIDGSESKGILYSEGKSNVNQRQFVLRNLRDFGVGRNTMEGKFQEDILEFFGFLQKNDGKFLTVNHLFAPFIINSLWSIIIGEKFQPDDPQTKYFADLTDRICRINTVMMKLAFYLPWMGTIMGDISGFNEKVEAFKEVYAYSKQRINEHKLTWVKGQARDLTDTYFDKVNETDDVTSSFHQNADFQGHVIGDLFMAAIETTNVSLEWFIYYLATYPLIQKKLQQEVDEIVGQSRLPSLNDRGQMPYTEAALNELLRVSSIVPLALFHRTLEDVNFHGFHIPKNTTVASNLYAVHHDPKVWSEPSIFKPERFIDETTGKVKRHESFFPFGYGKRNCIGERVVRDELFLYISSLAQRYCIKMPKNAPEVKQIFGLTLSATKFQVEFVKRDI